MNAVMDMQVEYRPVEALVPYARNARTHSAGQVAQIARSIEAFGFTNPVLVDGEGGIIAGHGRVLAARQLGMETVPVIELAHMTQAQKRAYVLADNQLALNAGWDQSLLRLELADLNDLGADLSLIGFDETDLAKYLEPEDRQGLTGDDAAPEAPEQPVSRLGDLWQLGSHRLLCGDATNPEDMALLMGQNQAAMVFTDPPYGMAYGGGRAAGSSPKGARVKAHGMILNDELVGERLTGLVESALTTAFHHAVAKAAAYVCGTWRTYGEFVDAMAGAGLEPKACIVWDKGSIGLGNAHFRPQHEFLLYHPGAWYGGKGESDVWTLPRDATSSYVHPTQKPVALIVRALRNSSRLEEVVLDPFGGSGSILIACEKTGRNARLMELDPRYVDVIVRRWQDWTGESAVLADGNSFHDVAHSRREAA
jgi:DNA modification methylase